MTEFGRTPFFTASEFEAMGYRMVIWPVSALRVAEQGAGEALRRASGATAARRTCSTRCRPRQELYDTIGYHEYEALDASIVEDGRAAGDAAARLKPQRGKVGRAAVEVRRVLEGLAEAQHVALGERLADDLDAERQAAR